MTVSAKLNGLGLGKTDEWYTPQSVFSALGERFDLDPAHPAFGMTCVPTRTYYSRDGLDLAWFGFVWLNPPFGGRGAIEPWLDRFFLHGNGIALTPDRTSAPWFHRAWPKADAVLFTRKIRFIDCNGNEGGSPANGTTLWASGERAVAALRRAAGHGFGLFALIEPVAAPHASDESVSARQTLSRPSEGFAAARGATVSNSEIPSLDFNPADSRGCCEAGPPAGTSAARGSGHFTRANGPELDATQGRN